MWFAGLICWVCRFRQAYLKPSSRKKGCATFLNALNVTGYSLVGHRQASHKLGVHRVLFCLILYLVLFEKKKEKK
jgi:hypothetical protein